MKMFFREDLLYNIPWYQISSRQKNFSTCSLLMMCDLITERKSDRFSAWEVFADSTEFRFDVRSSNVKCTEAEMICQEGSVAQWQRAVLLLPGSVVKSLVPLWFSCFQPLHSGTSWQLWSRDEVEKKKKKSGPHNSGVPLQGQTVT